MDAHHHLWDRPDTCGCDLLPELLDDIAGSGRRVVQTVYAQARSMWRDRGPEEHRPVGGVEFARATAEEAAAAGPVRACDAIVGCADPTLGDMAFPVLEQPAQSGGGRLRGIRFPVALHADLQVRFSAALPPSSSALALAWRPVVDGCRELFGPSRCMFESNFPVDKGMTRYGPVWTAFKRLAAPLAEAEQDALFAATARRVYRMGLPGPVSSPAAR